VLVFGNFYPPDGYYSSARLGGVISGRQVLQIDKYLKQGAVALQESTLSHLFYSVIHTLDRPLAGREYRFLIFF
jgi:hypothetical protein